jgi:molybdopterin synthase sulfur carrier subunit
MNVKIKLFATCREVVGKNELDLQVENPCTVHNIIEDLKQKYPKLEQMNSFLIAVNMEYAQSNAPVRDGDVIAIIPPVSGG